MTLVAAVLTGTAVYLAVGAATGNLPRLRPGPWRRPTQIGRRQQWLIQGVRR